MPHRWTELDDKTTLCVYRFGIDGLPYSIESIADRLGIGHDSFKLRLRNFAAIAGNGGLGHFAEQSKRIYELYSNTPEPQLRGLVFPEL